MVIELSYYFLYQDATKSNVNPSIKRMKKELHLLDYLLIKNTLAFLFVFLFSFIILFFLHSFLWLFLRTLFGALTFAHNISLLVSRKITKIYTSRTIDQKDEKGIRYFGGILILKGILIIK